MEMDTVREILIRSSLMPRPMNGNFPTRCHGKLSLPWQHKGEVSVALWVKNMTKNCRFDDHSLSLTNLGPSGCPASLLPSNVYKSSTQTKLHWLYTKSCDTMASRDGKKSGFTEGRSIMRQEKCSHPVAEPAVIPETAVSHPASHEGVFLQGGSNKF